MTKQDYIKVAAVIHEMREMVTESTLIDRDSANATLNVLENNLIELFETDNPRFDKQRFEIASGRRRARVC